MSEVTTIALQPSFFTERETVFVEHGDLVVSLFRFSTGVCGLRLVSSVGEVTMLPFQGQQIWSVQFDDRPLTMRSMFTQPRQTDDYLATYGGFLLHCGAMAMGCPGPQDTHPLHGELPNAPYEKACLHLGRDDHGLYAELQGEYRHTIAFTCDYHARPAVRLYNGATTMHIRMEIHNQMSRPMELMYLAHINFRPVDYSRLVYTAPCHPGHVRVRRSVPAHVKPTPEYRSFLDQVATRPDLLNVLLPEHRLDPEVVLLVDYLADQEGWAHSLQVHPDGYASYVRHRPAELPHGTRWILRSGDEDALGLVLPATAGPEGYTAEKAKGNIRVLPSKASASFSLEVGLLRPSEARQVEKHIEAVLGSV